MQAARVIIAVGLVMMALTGLVTGRTVATDRGDLYSTEISRAKENIRVNTTEESVLHENVGINSTHHKSESKENITSNADDITSSDRKPTKHLKMPSHDDPSATPLKSISGGSEVFYETSHFLSAEKKTLNVSTSQYLSENNVELYAPTSLGVSSELCRQHSERMVAGVRGGETWALKMMDASSHGLGGMMVANLVQLGNYDECLSVQLPSDLGVVRGQHCQVSLGARGLFSDLEQRRKSDGSLLLRQIGRRLDELSGDVTAIVSHFGATVAVCIPSSCGPRDLERHLRAVMRSRPGNISVRVDPHACSSRTDETILQSHDWVAIAIVAGCAVVMAASTIIDIMRPNLDNLLTAFSVYSNGIKLLRVAVPSADNMPALNGVRFLSMLWIVMIHHILMIAVTPSINYSIAESTFYTWGNLTFTNGTIAVESFFLLSGMLVCFNFLKEREKGVQFNILRYYFHRYIRLTAPYAAMMLMVATLVNYLGEGPFWKANMAASRSGCERFWLYGLLYVNNYYPGEEMCMGRLGETWYLAVDMQLFWLSPLLLYPLWRWPALGKALLGVLVAVGLTVACAVPYVNRFPFTAMPGNDVGAYSQYFTTHTRYTPWLIGVGLGYLLHHTRHAPLRLSRSAVVGCWALGLLVIDSAFLPAYFFYQPEYEYNRLTTSLFTGLNRPVFALGVAWVVLACVKGYGGAVNSLLSSSPMQVLGRLTYTMYLTHITVLRHFFAATKASQQHTEATVILNYISNVILCIGVAMVLHLAVEAPALNIERVLLRKWTPTVIKKSSTNGQTGERITSLTML